MDKKKEKKGLRRFFGENVMQSFSKLFVALVAMFWLVASVFAMCCIWNGRYEGLDSYLGYINAPVTGVFISYFVKAAFENVAREKNSGHEVPEDCGLPEQNSEGFPEPDLV